MCPTSLVTISSFRFIDHSLTSATLSCSVERRRKASEQHEFVILFAAPAKVSSLTLTTTFDALTALWDRPTSLYAFFIVELQLNGSDEKTTLNGTDETQSFSNLKSGADYEVAVYTVSGHLRSKPVRRSKFTRASLWSLLLCFLIT